MKVRVDASVLEIVQGDITKQDVEAVANAANSRLAPGGGVAGAIHKAAGPKLWEECKKLGGCKTGEAKITKGYRLPSRYVIHTVGPIYSGKVGDAELLKSCYQNSLELSIEKRIKSIAFPAISTGAFGYPLSEAAEIALKTTIDFLKHHNEISLFRFVLYDSYAYRTFEDTLKDFLRSEEMISVIKESN